MAAPSGGRAVVRFVGMADLVSLSPRSDRQIGLMVGSRESSDWRNVYPPSWIGWRVMARHAPTMIRRYGTDHRDVADDGELDETDEGDLEFDDDLELDDEDDSNLAIDDKGEGDKPSPAMRGSLKFALQTLLVALFFLTAGAWLGDHATWYVVLAGGGSLALSAGAFEWVIISTHDDDWEFGRVAEWHTGQLVMASSFMVVLGLVGSVGLVAAVFALESGCETSPAWWCSAAKGALYVVTGLYALCTIVLWPTGAWWNWFGARERRRRQFESRSGASGDNRRRPQTASLLD